MLNITLVSYINTRPFIDGLEKIFSGREASLNLVAPADCARDLKDGNCDLALVPVGALPDFSNIRLLPNYCLGANGKVTPYFYLASNLSKRWTRSSWTAIPVAQMALRGSYSAITGNSMFRSFLQIKSILT